VLFDGGTTEAPESLLAGRENDLELVLDFDSPEDGGGSVISLSVRACNRRAFALFSTDLIN
jgi:hypothetical protein